jgi:phosphoglycolate phosphatase
MLNNPVRAVLFDLDGTLLDTAPDLVGALNHLRESEDLPAVEVADYSQYVSQGALGLIRAGMPAGDDRRLEQRKASFLSYYADNSFAGTCPYPGVSELLVELESRAIPWAIVTNKPEYLTLPILEHLNWSRRPSCVICGDTLAHSKPHPLPVQMAAQLSGVAPSRSLMVGDDPRDLEAARAAGAIPVLAAYGYGASEVLQAGTADAEIIQQPGDLLSLLTGDFSARGA